MASFFLDATGNIGIDAQREAKVSASHLGSNQGITMTTKSMTIDGMTNHYINHSEEHETGFGVDSCNGFVLIQGSEGKMQNEESFEHQ
ncbi:hypothetical protein V4B17_02490 [Bartonella sp. B23]